MVSRTPDEQTILELEHVKVYNQFLQEIRDPTGFAKTQIPAFQMRA